MRKSLFIALLVFFSCSLFAQSLLDTTNVWNNLVRRLPSFSITTETLKINGDTLINDVNYWKVFRSQDEFQTDWETYGYIRETAGERVYYRTDSTADVLLYDFALEQDDVVEVYGITGYGDFETISSQNFLVAIKDSVQIGEDTRARLQLVPVYENDTLEDVSEVWIEGVGSLSGLLHWEACLCGGNAYELLCFSHDGSLLWQNPDFTTCYYTYLSSSEFETKELSVYPNPANNYVQLNLPDYSGECTITMYSVLGTKVKSHKTSDRSVRMILTDISEGYYFLEIELPDQPVVIKKVMREN